MEKFSDFFELDSNLPQYTACVSVIIFKTLMKNYFNISAEGVTTKTCDLNGNFKVPAEYPPSQLFGNTGHCLKLAYRYISDLSSLRGLNEQINRIYTYRPVLNNAQYYQKAD